MVSIFLISVNDPKRTYQHEQAPPMGDIGLGQALRDHRIRLSGKTKLKQDISTWLGRNYFADVNPAK